MHIAQAGTPEMSSISPHALEVTPAYDVARGSTSLYTIYAGAGEVILRAVAPASQHSWRKMPVERFLCR